MGTALELLRQTILFDVWWSLSIDELHTISMRFPIALVQTLSTHCVVNTERNLMGDASFGSYESRQYRYEKKWCQKIILNPLKYVFKFTRLYAR